MDIECHILFDNSYIIRERKKFTERKQSTKTTQEARMEGHKHMRAEYKQLGRRYLTPLS